MRRLSLLGVLLFASYAYFYQAGGWSQNSRFDLVRAIVEQGTIRIDAFHDNTGDKAVAGGHYYTDKAPGASWTAVPAVAVVRKLVGAAGGAVNDPRSIAWLSYVATLASAAMPGALAGVCLFLLARRFGASEYAALMATIGFGLSTPMWAYGTLFFGHALAAACLVGACLAADMLRDSPTDAARDVRQGAMVGLLAGWAVVTEFPSAIGAVILSGLALMYAWPGGRARVVRVGVAIALGAGLCATALGIYQNAAFGSPFHISYASEENSELLRAGVFGITLPRPRVIAELLWGSYRGLLPLSPIVLFAPIGLWRYWRRSGGRWTALAAGATMLLYLLMNAAYEHWEGGWDYGPRHLVPALVLWCLGIAGAWDAARSWGRAVMTVCICFGIACSLVAVATTPQPPAPGYAHPMRELLWPAFHAGRLAINDQSILDVRPPHGWAGLRPSGVSWNLGQKTGLQGLMSLTPLAAVWILGGLVWLSLAPETRPDG